MPRSAKTFSYGENIANLFGVPFLHKGLENTPPYSLVCAAAVSISRIGTRTAVRYN